MTVLKEKPHQSSGQSDSLLPGFLLSVSLCLFFLLSLSLSLSLSLPRFLREVVPVLAEESTRVIYSSKWGHR